MKSIKRQKTLSLTRIIALTTLFSALSMLPRPASESNSTFSQAFGPRQLLAQETDKDHHHDHSNCNHEVETKTDKDHKHEEVHDHAQDSHDNHDHQNELKHDDHSDCNHDQTRQDHALSEPQAAESCSESAVDMSAEEIKRFGIITEKVTRNRLEVLAQTRGEISLNRDQMAHIVPRVSGIVQEVRSTLGDFVEEGEIMAILESGELADAKTDYLTATKHLKLAKSVFQREEKLWRKKVSSEQDYLTAERDFAETRITLQSCEQRLRILGFSVAGLKKLPSEPIAELTRFAVRSPFSGRVIKKNIVLGEVISDAIEIFVVADLKTVWVDLNLYRKDSANIRKGQKVLITVSSQTQPIEAVIDYVAPLVDEKTRTTLARVILDNQNEELRPGSFVTAEIITKKISSGVIVARDILQEVGGKTCVFIQDDHGFEPRPVTLGRSNEKEVEISAGLHPGEMVVAKNGFRLKAALETGVGSGCSSPGHAH